MRIGQRVHACGLLDCEVGNGGAGSDVNELGSGRQRGSRTNCIVREFSQDRLHKQSIRVSDCARLVCVGKSH